MTLRIEPAAESRLPTTDFSSLRFGDVFSDHMVQIVYADGAWQQGDVLPFGPITLSPAVSVLHYGQAVFEGLKAFHHVSGCVNVFRADAHYERFIRSCDRMGIPQLPRETWFDAIDTLLDIDKGWVPTDPYKSFYIRPFVMATEPYLGVRQALRYRFMVIGGPVGNYYAEGVKPVRLTTMPAYARAMRGGTGSAKSPGNYAATLKPSFEAMAKGYAQVLWLDAAERRWVEEVGTSNLFFLIGDTLVTPPLSDTILAGVIRDSVLTLASDWGLAVEQRPVSIDEVFRSGEAGQLREVFASGTAAVISPVGHIHHDGRTVETDMVRMGPLAQRFYNALTGIHHGQVPDPHGWCRLLG